MIESQLVWILAGCVLSAYLLALSGIPSYLRRESLVGDALSHAIFPGVVLAVWISGNNSSWTTYAAGIFVGILALYLIQAIQKRTPIPKDGATGIVLIVFFSIGLVLMGRLQRSGIPLFGIQHVLLGKAATLLPSDLIGLGALAALGSLLFFLFQKWIWLQAFDSKFAQHSGLPLRGYTLFLSAWTALVLTATIQVLGAVLSSAMLLTPAALGHFLSHKPRNFIIIALFSSMSAALVAGFVSASLPSMSTGALMVVMMFLLSFPVFLFHPSKGVLMKWMARKKEARRWRDENTLKLLFHKTAPVALGHTPCIKRLAQKRLIEESTQGRWQLTLLGAEEAGRIVRKHRLWETFLHQRLSIPEDHVHDNAELMEHVLDDAAEERLAKELNYPVSDPHKSPIPPQQ